MIQSIKDFIDNMLSQPGWEIWPFSMGYGESWSATVARFLFVGLILLVLSLLLRKLFGPKGWFREDWIDREADAERAREIAKLDQELADGEITEAIYKLRKKRIMQ